MKMATTYNAYSDIKSIVDLKGQWDEANKAGDTAKKNQIAATAQAYYDKLKNNDYGGVAQALSANGYSGAKAILDSYAPATETKTETKVEPSAYTQSMQSATKNNETLKNYINSDRKDVQGKYDDIYDYANQDVTKTDEYKSTYDNMMAKYDLSALQGRDNAVASGGSSNGGNIDSYSAANAMRQQAALTATGQQVAHQAGLDAYNSRISNVSNILNNLGIYNSGTYDAMNQVIGNDSAIAQQYFDNDETAKNNEVARLSEKANVTGYVPNEWAYENNIYLNSDGTVRAEYLTDEFDNTGGFTTIINNAKSRLATTTDPTERANLQATINYATQAKALKTFSSPKYSKYSHEVESVAPQKTADYDLTDKQIQSAEKIALGEAQSNALSEAAKADAEYQKAYLGYMGDVYTADKKYEKEKADDDFVNNAITTHGNLINHFRNITGGGTVATFVDKFFTPDSKGMYGGMSEDAAILCIEQNIHRYNIDKADAEKICDELGINKSWLDDYRERKESDGGETVDGESKTWIQSGMIKKKK